MTESPGVHGSPPATAAAEARLWMLAGYWTGRAGYRRGTKAEGLHLSSPLIDCSGWVALLLAEAMRAANTAAGRVVHDPAPFDVPAPWSDRIVADIEGRGSPLLAGREITAEALPFVATIGVNEGPHGWEGNRPRIRGINHIAQIVRRPGDGEPFVSEAYGAVQGDAPPGIHLTPLGTWLERRRREIEVGRAWAGDAFRKPAR